MFTSSVLRRVAACTALVSILAACGGGGVGTHSALPSTPSTTPYSGPQSLAGFIWGQNELKGATLVGPATFGALSMDVGVKMQDEAGLIRYAQNVSNPASASYRQFLTPQQIANRYGAAQTDYAAAAQYFRKYGIRVAGWPQRLTLAISGTQPQLQRAFGTTFSVYQRNGKSFIAPSSAPHFETTVAVTSVSNLVTATKNFRQFVPVRAGNSTLSGYSPGQIRKVFDYTSAYSAGFNGTGINLGIIGTGPISPNDVPTYGAMFHVSAATVTQVVATDEGVKAGIGASIPSPSASPPYGYPYSSGLQTPPPVTPQCLGPLPSCNPEDGEAQLDTEQQQRSPQARTSSSTSHITRTSAISQVRVRIQAPAFVHRLDPMPETLHNPQSGSRLPTTRFNKRSPTTQPMFSRSATAVRKNSTPETISIPIIQHRV